jgi:hypothetical protein
MRISLVLFSIVSLSLAYSCKPREDRSTLESNAKKSSDKSSEPYLKFFYEKSDSGEGWTAPEGMYLDWTRVKIYPSGDRTARLVVQKLRSMKANQQNALIDVKNATTLELDEADARANRIPLQTLKKHVDLFQQADALTNGQVTMEGRVYYNKSYLLPGGSHVGYFHITFRARDLAKIDSVYSSANDQAYKVGDGIKSLNTDVFTMMRVVSP